MHPSTTTANNYNGFLHALVMFLLYRSDICLQILTLRCSSISVNLLLSMLVACDFASKWSDILCLNYFSQALANWIIVVF